jgi:ribonuclease I
MMFLIIAFFYLGSSHLDYVPPNYSSIKYCNLALKQCPKYTKMNDQNTHSISIHGFWPEFDFSNNFPQWCNKSACDDFSIDDLETIRDDLENYWYSCQGWSTRTEDLWRHEWCRHGTCLTSNPIDYFTVALSAFKQASDNNWFQCCYQSDLIRNNLTQNDLNCMIPFDIHGNWLKYCH